MARRQPPDREPAGLQAQPSAAPCGTAGLPAGLPKRRLLVVPTHHWKFCPVRGFGEGMRGHAGTDGSFRPPTREESAQPTTPLLTHTPRPRVASAQAPGVARVPPDEARSPPLLSREGAGGAPHTAQLQLSSQCLPLLESPSGCRQGW